MAIIKKVEETEMKLTFIGCGDSFADELGNNSALLEFEDTNLLIDIPDSNYSRIKHIGKEYSEIQNIFITHLHGDHINGLERLAYYRTFATPVVRPNENIPKPNLYLPETLYQGLWDSVKNGLGITANGIKHLDAYFDVHLVKVQQEVDGTVGEFTINGVTFHITPSKHVPNMPVYGLLVKDEFYYSADSTFDEEAVRYYLQHTKKIFHDIHFFSQTLAVHASVRDFKNLHEDEKEKVYAMHYDDHQKEKTEIDGIKLVKPYQPIQI